MGFDSEYLWLEGQIVPCKDAKIHFLTSSLHYGTSVFEGIRCYKTDKGPAVFRLKDHISRLIKSANIIGMAEIPYTFDEIYDATLELIQINNFEECYIRPLIYISDGGWNLTVDQVKIDMGIAVWRWTNFLGEEALKNGIRANVSSYSRHHPNITMTKGKISGNYPNSVLAKTESVRAGFDEAILLDHDGNVSECSGENLFMVRNGIIYTPPRTTILEGITRDSIITLARDLGYDVVEEMITRDQLYIADEVFVTGTAAEVIALREIDHRKIGSGTTGEICSNLQKLFTDVIHARSEDYLHWNDFVNEYTTAEAI